ncbi:MAG: PH domain-containing protein [Mariprofundaceae bacterium]|nr:PH domain-containing protein [Mariprofundaceae bacterium]
MNQATLYYSDRPSWLNQIGSFAAMAILALMPLFFDMPRIQIVLNIMLALLLMLAIIYNRYTWSFRIDDGHIQSRHGIMSFVQQQSITLKEIRDIQVKQTAIQRMFDVGDLEFSSAGTEDAKIVFTGIKSPLLLKERVLPQQNKKKRLKKSGSGKKR